MVYTGVYVQVARVCLPTGMCMLIFYRGKVGLVLTNLNWSGWVLATDIITVRRESLPCPGYADCTQCAAV